MSDKTQTISFLSSAAGSSFTSWMKVLYAHKVDPKYRLRAFGSTLVTLIGLPFQLIESLVFSIRIALMKKLHPPIFILGHWRSGTTLLQNIITQDPALGRFTHYQSFLPEGMVWHRFAKPLVKVLLPKNRIVDDIKVTVNAPMEEEFGITNSTEYGYLHGWYFPKTMLFHLERDLLFRGKDGQKAKRKWKRIYLKILKKAALYWGKQRLALKNPANTGRVKTLLEMFPEAKFIHIYRDPLTVYLSTMRLYLKTFPELQFQEISREELAKNCIQVYKKVMQEYFATRDLIPKGNLIEVKYENFEKDKMGHMEKIYGELGMEGWKEAKPFFQEYIEGIKGFKKNVHEVDIATKELIANEFAFAYHKLGYDLPELKKVATP